MPKALWTHDEDRCYRVYDHPHEHLCPRVGILGHMVLGRHRGKTALGRRLLDVAIDQLHRLFELCVAHLAGCFFCVPESGTVSVGVKGVRLSRGRSQLVETCAHGERAMRYVREDMELKRSTMSLKTAWSLPGPLQGREPRPKGAARRERAHRCLRPGQSNHKLTQMPVEGEFEKWKGIIKLRCLMASGI